MLAVATFQELTNHRATILDMADVERFCHCTKPRRDGTVWYLQKERGRSREVRTGQCQGPRPLVCWLPTPRSL